MIHEGQKNVASVRPVSRFGSISRLLYRRTWYGLVLVGIVIIVVVFWQIHHVHQQERIIAQQQIDYAVYKEDASSATKALDKYLGANPSLPDKQLNIVQVGNIYANHNEYQKAISLYLQAQALAPNSNVLYIDEALANAYDTSGQNTSAIIYYQKAIKALSPNSPDTLGTKLSYQQRIKELST